MIRCPACNTLASEEQRFCAECGARLPEPTPATTPASDEAPPQIGQTVLLPPEQPKPGTQPLDPPDPGATVVVPPELPAGLPPAATVVVPPEPTVPLDPPGGYAAYTPPDRPPPAPEIPAVPQKSGGNRGLCMIFGIIGGVLVVGCIVLALVVSYLVPQVVTNLPDIVPTIEIDPIVINTPAPIGTPVPEDEPPPAGETILLSDDFESESNSSFTPGSSDVADYTFENGTYAIQVNEPGYISWEPLPDTYRDVAIEIETTLQGPEDAAAAIIFRLQDGDNFYIFNVAGDRHYNLELYESGGETESIALIDWVPSDAINGVGELNILRVETDGSTIRLYVNGTLLDEISDSTFIRGSAAFATNTFSEGGAKVNFDNLIVSEMP
ncbi:MAG TPA: zinc ribbon domain-containing protein [Roseiflexaceae bacterium]|nr:zinc ribbon domain-containing protein [Roseiflexaceae bacterium]HMP39836.1 zinc ribbon domain-containing protein [Roseiflexaceae bacterium]